VSEVRVASTTDTPEAVNAAAEMLESDNLTQAAEEGSGGESRSSFEAVEGWTEKTGPRVASTTDDPKEIEEVQKDLDESKQERTDQYLGKTRRRPMHTVARLNESNDKLRQRVEELERGQQPTPQNGEAQQAQMGEASQGPASEQLRQAEAINWNLRAQLAAERYPDFDQVTAVDQPRDVINTLRQYDNGFDIAYHLGLHREKAQQIMEQYNAGNYQWVIARLHNLSESLRNGDLNNDNSSSSRRMSHRTRPEPIEPVKGSSSKMYRPLGEVPYREFRERRNRGET
jgi:ribosomal 30S subunit maturation factor RimM